jgi:hypothetical protein
MHGLGDQDGDHLQNPVRCRVALLLCCVWILFERCGCIRVGGCRDRFLCDVWKADREGAR